MTKEYRAELRVLRKNRKKVVADFRKELKAIAREEKQLARRHARAAAGTGKACIHIDKRIAILEGRLS
jgi:F0F1-type ATP synthase membrane subunit b/b'